jgi:small GTP-binding protein
MGERTDNSNFDHLVKLLLVGDSGVGKSSLLLRFSDGTFEEDQSPTIGVDFKLKYLDLDGKRLKLTVWDTAGQERFRTLTSSYYRGAQGVVFVYDLTRRETFENLAEIWAREVDMYGTVRDCAKIVIGNKSDKETERTVSREEASEFARENGCLFLECSAKSNAFVREAFEELVRGVLETPSLVEETSTGEGKVRLKRYQASKRECAC